MTDSCPGPAHLLTYALGRADAVLTQVVEQHLADCVKCRQDVAAIREAASAIAYQAAGPSVHGDSCLDELTIAALADGVIDPEYRAAALGHLATCPHCCNQLSGLARLLEAPQVAAELAKLDQTPRRRRLGRILGAGGVAAAAAAIVLIVGLQNADQTTTGETHRAAPLTFASPPAALSPVGNVERAAEFSWTSVPRADRYELTLFDATGSALWQQETTDTFAAVPDSVVIEPGASYFWRIAARIGFDRWTDTELIEFAVSQPRGDTP